MTENEQLLKKFFSESKKEVDDKGFSRQVMHRLPQRKGGITHIANITVTMATIALLIQTGGMKAIGAAIWETVTTLTIHGLETFDGPSAFIVLIVLLAIGTQRVASMA